MCSLDDVTRKPLKSCKTYTNMFPICETEATEAFNELDVNIDIFKKARVKMYKYSNRNQLVIDNGESKVTKESKRFKSVEDALLALSESSLDNASTSFSDKQSENEYTSFDSSIVVLESKEGNKLENDVIDKYIQENFALFDKSLHTVFESIAKISSAGYN